MKSYIYRVLDVDSDDDPLDHGVVEADSQSHALDLLQQRFSRIVPLAGTITVRLYPVTRKQGVWESDTYTDNVLTPTMPEAQHYTRVANPFDPDAGFEGCLFDRWETKERMFLAEQPDNNVWTVMDDENGDTIVMPGFHIVNALGYFVTDEPWPKEAEGLSHSLECFE